MTNEEYKSRVVEYLKGSPSQEVLQIVALIVDHVAEQDLDWLSEDDYETLHHQIFGPGWREEFGFEYWCNEWAQVMDFQAQYERENEP